MQITDGEKLILVMLSEMYEKLEIDGDIDPKFVRNAINNDHAWALRWEYGGIFGGTGDANPPVVNEVAEILTMWRVVEQVYEKLSAEEKRKLKDDVPIYETAFYGFDGNNETDHLSVARFMVDDLGRFDELKCRELNSHRETLLHYLGMLSEFKRIRDEKVYTPHASALLTADELTQIFAGGYSRI